MQPLINWRPLRAVVSVGMVLGAVGAFVASYLLLLWLFTPLVFLGALIAVGAAVPAAAAVWRGRSSGMQHGAVGLMLVLLVASAALGVARAVEEWEVRRLGVPTEAYLEFYVAATGALLLSAALLLAVAPRLLPARATVWACAITAAAGGTCLVLAAASKASTSCADSRLDPAAWRAARTDDRTGVVTHDERIAAAVVDCRLLHGRSRAEVLRALGKPDRRDGRTWSWSAGWVLDGLGPGDGQELILRFGRRDRVARASLGRPAD